MDAMTITATEQQLVISITRDSDMPDYRVPISIARAKSASLTESRVSIPRLLLEFRPASGRCRKLAWVCEIT